MAFGDIGRSWSSGISKLGGSVAQASKPNYLTNPNSPTPSFVQGGAGTEASRPTSIFDRARDALGFAATLYGPDTAYNNWQQGSLQSSLNMLGANYADNQRYANQDYGLAMRGLGLDRQALDVERANNRIDAGAAQRDINYYAQLLQMMPQYRSLSNQDYGNTLAQIGREGEMERKGIASEYTGRGAWFTPFHRINRENSQQAQMQAETKARIGYERDILGLNEKELGLTRNKGQAQDQAGKVANREALLNIEGARLGLTGEQLKNELDKTLANLGYSNFIDATQLLDQLAGSNRDRADIAMSIYDQAIKFMELAGGGQLGSIYQQYGG